MPWYLFALVTPTLYSVSTYIDKFLLEKRIREPLAVTALSGILSGLLGVCIATVTGWKAIGGSGIWILLGSGLLLVLYLIPYYEAMKREETSRVIPLFGFVPVFTLIMSSIFLHEGMGFKQMIGMLIVVAGGFLLSVKRVEGGIFRPRAALWFMVVSSILYGIVNILFRFVVHGATVNFWSVLAYEYIGKGIGGFLLLFIPQIRKSVARQFQMIKKSVGIVIVNDAINVTAETSEAFALTLATVPLVNIVGAIQPFMTLAVGVVLTVFLPHIIKEDIGKTAILHKLVSIALMFVGIYLVFA